VALNSSCAHTGRVEKRRMAVSRKRWFMGRCRCKESG
jgi:hypothetical protein